MSIRLVAMVLIWAVVLGAAAAVMLRIIVPQPAGGSAPGQTPVVGTSTGE